MPTAPLGQLTEPTIELVDSWMRQARATETKADQELMDQLVGLITDPDGVSFTMRFVDRVIRPESNRVAAHQLQALVSDHELPGFVSGLDSLLLRAGARLAPLAPPLVMPLARRRMRQMVGHLVVDAEPTPLERHLARRRAEGYRQNVNLLGEAVLGQGEADRRFQATLALLDQPDVDYVSVKVSAIAPQLEPWAWDDSIKRIVERLRPLYERAAATSPPTFVNLDMEEYHDLDITIAAFTQLLAEPALRGVDAGIVLQAYLPDALPALQGLAEWASDRRRNGGGSIKVRLVKGANLAMERVDAAVHGWALAPLATKAETDANYVRCLDWVLTPERLAGLRIGVASHNLFHVAFARLLAQSREVTDHVEFEMLQGMAPAEARVVRGETGNLLLYTPIVGARDFDVAISYLFRRLEETAAPDNFLRSLFSLAPGSPSFQAEASRFSASVTNRNAGPLGPNRTQTRPAIASHARTVERFVNEPDTDPTLPTNRLWAVDVMKPARHSPPSHPVIDSVSDVQAIMARARTGAVSWGELSLDARRQTLRSVADELARRRGDLISAMMHEGDKTFAQADPEVSEAIDFANYYADRSPELSERDGLRFVPLGVVAVIPPWNFPVAIPAGGVLAALAAGNSAILKPAPETPRCAEVVAECAWAAGVPTDALQFARVSENDAGQELITAADAVILTGASQTAALFTSWKPDLNLLAETSGKNAMIITPNADLDLAVANLTESAFGHSGQKCSAASLAICVGDVYESPRFRRQLVDAVRSMDVGPATTASTAVGPIISEPSPQLHRALTQLDPGEDWLVTPEPRDGSDGHGRLWSPGVRTGVVAGSWFHQTECFGPVLGVMKAATLDEAIAIANSSAFGLTGGIQSLDPDEIEQWLAQIEVGNAYVNRGITGAIVQRQPFGGWKRSSVGPGSKAGGPNYVQQLGTWTDVGAGQGEPHDSGWLDRARAADRSAWADYFGIEHDPTGLFCEANRFRYRPHPRLAIRVAGDADPVSVDRVRAAIEVCGSTAEWSNAATETADQFAARWPASNTERVRIVGSVEPELWPAARAANVHLETRPVVADSRIELLHYLREQSISQTLHRFGNLIGAA